VGHTYVPANLSPEVYYDAGVLAVDGFSANYSFEDAGGRYWSIQAITGKRDIVQRVASIQGDSPLNKFDIGGLVVVVEGENYRLQAAHHGADISRKTKQFQGLPLIDGQVNVNARLTNLGAEYRWTKYTLRGELSQIEQAASLTEFGPPTFTLSAPKFGEHGANLLLIRKVFGHHAIYGSYGRFISEFDDQYSFAVGGRYNLSPSDSIKLELHHVVEKSNRIQLSDNRIPNTTFNFLSVSYNWVWE